MVKKLVRLALAYSLVGFASVSYANAQVELNNRTVITFSQPVEVPGKILPAGTYTFEMHDSGMNRHVVEIFDKGGTKPVAIVLAIPDYRLKATAETVIKFDEVAAGQPQAIRAWFYPGQTVGQELVYSKTRAHALAAASHLVVPAVADTEYADARADSMKTAELVAVTPEKTEVPVTTIQTTPPEPAPAVAATPAPESTPARTELPHTASNLTAIALFGLSLIGLGFAVRRFAMPRPTR